MRMYDIIVNKRNGLALTKEEIEFFITGYTSGRIPDYQASALLMAIYFQGMTDQELKDFTLAMVHSGDVIDLSAIDGIKVDKHSTGGVGDKTTLVLIPLVASLGIPVPKMSGHGLGHTGGTLDKLESIPNFNIRLSTETFTKLVNEHHLSVVGQTSKLAPADEKIYQLRDVTATVHSIPLIASSIMSKKIASGADRIVLDIKTGTGAFMNNLEDARELAKQMVSIGELAHKETVAVLSNMYQPLGFAIGNTIEVIEAIETLKGRGPDDLTELCLRLGSQMVLLADQAETEEEAEEKLLESLQSGRALEYFRRLIRIQGGDELVLDDYDRLPQAKYKIKLQAQGRGYISAMDTEQIGIAAMSLGAGRERMEDKIDYAAGIQLHKKIGDYVDPGDSLMTLYSNRQDTSKAEKLLHDSITISGEKPSDPMLTSLIYDFIK